MLKLNTLVVPYAGKTHTLRVNDATEYSEPRIWVDLPDDTILEITLEKAGIPVDKQHYSIRRHYSIEDFENGAYEETCGIIETSVVNTEAELIETLSILFTSYAKKGLEISSDYQ